MGARGCQSTVFAAIRSLKEDLIGHTSMNTPYGNVIICYEFKRGI